jgi:imidazolonepropionase
MHIDINNKEAILMSDAIQASTIIRHIGQLVTVAQHPIAGASGTLQVVSDAALAVLAGQIVWLGLDSEAEQSLAYYGKETIRNAGPTPTETSIIDAHGAVVTPGLVDSHTHLIFAGQRTGEFHLRRDGKSYGDLLAQGRGILTTVEATRSATTENLLALASARLDSIRALGTTTVEVKTGYGLDFATEERCLRIIKELNAREAASASPQRLRLVPTFLGAHSIPAEYRARRELYVDQIVEQMLPAFVNLARFCDVYCERETYTVAETRKILTRAKELGYKLKIHADQLSPSGGSRLAAEVGAVSADHLDFASDADLDAMRAANVVATLLPGCSYTLRTPYPSARRLLDHGLKVALATDFNPGTCYCENMQMIIGLAMSAMGMSLEEALIAATINGAQALALQDQVGSIEIGKRCELALWSIQDYREIGYHFGVNLLQATLVIG